MEGSAALRIREKSVFEDGDLVWGIVKGFPHWPGQVMPVHLAPKSIADTKKNPKAHLIAFLGDLSYGAAGFHLCTGGGSLMMIAACRIFPLTLLPR